MKTSNFIRITLMAASITCIFACKKDSSSSSSSTTSTTSIETAADDQAMVSNENDALDNDATAAVSASPSISGASYNPSGVKSGSSVLGGPDSLSICDATITFDTTSSTKTITIIYNGTNCWGNRTRTGSVSITTPRVGYWKAAGAQVSITVTNLKITRIRDGKSIVINGTKTITNTDGGLLVDLATIDSVVHDISSSFNITYANGTTRSWSEQKHRVFTYNNGIVITTTGGESGVNRAGVSFTSVIAQPKVIEQSCDLRLVSGKDSTTRTDNITSSTTYGLDVNGNPVSSCPLGYYYAEFIWSNGNNGKTFTYIFPY